MNDIIHAQSALPLPQSKIGISIRSATMDDLPFIDRLQKKQSRELGFFPTKAIEGKIKLGHVLIAQRPETGDHRRETIGDDHTGLPSEVSSLPSAPIGYLIGNDQYFKRDDVGCIFQINVAPEYRRSLVAANLLKAQFERSAYGCKLYCCWCAQDLQANYFWESMGFSPIAFRAGSEGKKRVHIFWMKRIRANDTTTPWWFPSETKGGAMMQDRLVFPIPQGTHWKDVMPIVLPRDTYEQEVRQIEDARQSVRVKRTAEKQPDKRPPLMGGLRFADPEPEPVVKEKPKREKKPKAKNNPKYVAAARELRDRYLERVNESPAMIANAKYDVAREITATAGIDIVEPATQEQPQLAA